MSRWVDVSAGQSAAPYNEICCYAVFFGNKVSAFAHMKKVRSRKESRCRIIAFGPFAAVFFKEILSRKLADIVVSADAEFIIPLILSAGNEISCLSSIPNLSYIQNGEIVTTGKHSFNQLDDLPFIGPFLYKHGDRPAHLMASRGCQYHCVYCDRNVFWGGGVRRRSVANVLSEVRELVECHQVKVIEFLDEDLAADRLLLARICEGMCRIKGQFHWECSACVDSVDQEILLLMGRSRCREIYFGVESASPHVLRQIGKTYGRQEIFNAVRWSQEAGMQVEVMITTGNPGETEYDRNLTLSALDELGQDVKVHTNKVVILPGTALYRKGLREGWFTEKSFFEDRGRIIYDDQRCMTKNKT